MSDFFEKLKKGMDVEAPKNIEEDIEEETEEKIEEKPKKKARKISKKSKDSKTNKIKIKKEPLFSKDAPEESDDIFQKDGQLTIDVFETEKYIIIQSAVAGISPEDLDITIEKDMVSIKGKRERSVSEEIENYFYQECYWGRFSREVVLPAEVDKNKAEAIMKNGILTIKIPKINPSTNQKLNIKNIE